MKSIHEILLKLTMKVTIKDLEVKLWEKTEMPEALKGADGKMVKDEKGKVVNTGKMVEYTTYTFRDITGETLKLMTAKNQFRELEGSTIDLVLNLTRREFQGKTETKVALVDVLEK